MRKKNLLKLAVTAALVLGLAGCASTSKRGEMSGDDINGYSQSADGAPNFYGKDISESEKELLSQRTFYFDYDRADLSETDMTALKAHARFLKNYPQSHIRIEGHTDERGTREYNIALGERRGNVVADTLIQLGISRNQITVVSFGKEKPSALGHEETSWSQNRRAVLHYEAS